MEVNIREIKKDEIPQLSNFLYQAIFQKENSLPLPFETIQFPEIYIYIDNFGKYGDDYCLIAEHHGQLIGAVWVRLLNKKI